MEGPLSGYEIAAITERLATRFAFAVMAARETVTHIELHAYFRSVLREVLTENARAQKATIEALTVELTLTKRACTKMGAEVEALTEERDQQRRRVQCAVDALNYLDREIGAMPIGLAGPMGQKNVAGVCRDATSKIEPGPQYFTQRERAEKAEAEVETLKAERDAQAEVVGELLSHEESLRDYQRLLAHREAEVETLRNTLAQADAMVEILSADFGGTYSGEISRLHAEAIARHRSRSGK